MRRFVSPAAVVVVMLGALAPLLLLDGSDRAWGFRIYASFVGLAALRRILVWSDTVPRPERSVFAPPPRRVPGAARARTLLGRARTAGLTGTPLLVQSASSSAGGLHHRLRPVLQEIADERLRARHGTTLDGEGAARVVPAKAWELVRPDRQRPADRLAPGTTLGEIDAVLDDLETL